MEHCHGCAHCLDCLPIALTYEICDATRRKQVHEPYVPWWPANIDTPTHYYRLKRRAMEHQLQEQARAGPHGDPAVWRWQGGSRAAHSELRARRGCPQLAVRLPSARTNLGAADELEFMGYVGTATTQQYTAAAHPTQAAPQARPAAQPRPAQQQPSQGKRRARWQAAAAQPKPQPPTCWCTPPPQQHQADLLASLQQREECHRQQLAAAAGADKAHLMAACQAQGYTWQHAPLGECWPYGMLQLQPSSWAFGSCSAALPPRPRAGATVAPLAC